MEKTDRTGKNRMKNLCEEEIVELFFARDERAIRAVSEQFGAYLSRIAENVLKNREDSEECLNDAYLALWKSIPPERPRSLKAYAARTVRNAAINLYKSRKRRAQRIEPTPIDELSEYLVSPRKVEDEVDAQQLKAVVQRFVISLSPNDRYIFVCRYYCFDSVSLIARSLRTSERTVHKHLTKIKEGLKEELRKEGFNV